MPSYIDLVNPAALSSTFNINQGLLAGQNINLNNQAQQENALSLSNQVRELQAALDFESSFRSQNPALGLGNRFGSAANSLANPFAALQAFNSQASINQVGLNQQAAQQNLSLGNALINSFGRDFNRDDDEDEFRSVLPTSTRPVNRVDSTGARSILPSRI